MAEPTTFISGYSVTWERDLPDYPTASYTLVYAFRRINGSGPVLVFSSEAGAGLTTHVLTLTPAQSATLAADTYSVVGYVVDDATNGTTTKAQVFGGTITVQPDPATATTGDRRSHVRRMVENLQTALEKLTRGTIVTMSVQGKTWTQRNLSELRAELARYEFLLQQEEAAERGQQAGKIFVRFNRF